MMTVPAKFEGHCNNYIGGAMEKMKFMIPCYLGVEKLVADELKS